MVGPGHLHWIILVLTHPCFLNASHFWAHLHNFHAPARGVSWPSTSSVCWSSPRPHAFSYCLCQFPSGMELQVPSSTYYQCPTQVPWKDQSIQDQSIQSHLLQLRIALSQQEPTCLEIPGRLHPPPGVSHCH